jgi:GWxTD domain-containing protein
VAERAVAAVLVALLASAAAPPASAAPAAPVDSLARARTLVRWSLPRLASPVVEQRQRAVRDLDEALRLAPRDPEAWVARGRAYAVAGFDRESRACFERALEFAPGDPAALTQLAFAWKREWLRRLDAAALERALAALRRLTAVRPLSGDAWLWRVPLHYERGDLDSARVAAERAVEVRPGRGLSWMALAYTSYREGRIERAEDAFRRAVRWLDGDLRARFEDVTPLADPAERAAIAAAKPAEREALGRRFWKRIDADPTTPENETRLEYWSRIAHTALLFDDPLHPDLDARAEAYVRYGPSGGATINPTGVPLFSRFENPGRAEAIRRGDKPVVQDYPFEVMMLAYPDLGMRLLLQDRSMSGRYEWPLLRTADPLASPDPRVLEARRDLMALGGGQAVFPTLPPRTQRLDLAGVVTRFEGERGPRLVAQIEAPGGPADSLFGRWVVIDVRGDEVARAAGVLGPSVCDPAERRTTTFAADLRPGDYTLALSVRDRAGRRGLFRAGGGLREPRPGLSLSDVVITCGSPELQVQAGSVRLDADVDATVSSASPLVAYFEIYRLAAGPDSLARFEYEYRVRRLQLDAAAGATVAPGGVGPVSREETQIGSLRRQFVSVPVQSLAPGRYRLEIQVRDLVGGAVVRRDVEFTRR